MASMRIGDRIRVLHSPYGFGKMGGEIVDLTKDGFVVVELDNGLVWSFPPHSIDTEEFLGIS